MKDDYRLLVAVMDVLTNSLKSCSNHRRAMFVVMDGLSTCFEEGFCATARDALILIDLLLSAKLHFLEIVASYLKRFVQLSNLLSSRKLLVRVEIFYSTSTVSFHSCIILKSSALGSYE